jgi:hypothetical protein
MFKNRNSVHDPLTKPDVAADGGRELFSQMSKVANGFGSDDVIAAAANLLINAIRQQAGTRQRAEVVFDDLFGRTKATLLKHYDGSGNRRSVFPFDQHITIPLISSRNRLNGD